MSIVERPEPDKGGQARMGGSRLPPDFYVFLLLQGSRKAFPGYLDLGLTVMVFGFTSSAFGRVMLRTPFSKSAWALSDRTAVGRVMVRSNEPQRRSRM
jgi:hypothetical protein